MTIDEPTVYDPLGVGSPVRLAVLLLLGKQPEGVHPEALRKTVEQADTYKLLGDHWQLVARKLQRSGLVAVEKVLIDGRVEQRYFSPAARYTAKVRGNWRPPSPRAVTEGGAA